MKSYKQQLLDFLKGWGYSMYSLNTKGAKLYGATFYKRNAWDGEFYFFNDDIEEAKQKYKYVINLNTMEFIKG